MSDINLNQLTIDSSKSPMSPTIELCSILRCLRLFSNELWRFFNELRAGGNKRVESSVGK